MLVSDAFKGHLKLEVTPVIHAVNTDLVVLSGEATSQLQGGARNDPVFDLLLKSLFQLQY
jgi:hypothetical protein